MNQSVTNNNEESVFKTGGKFGLKGAKTYASVLLLFIGINLLFFVIAVFLFFKTERSNVQFYLLLGVLVTGLISTALAVSFTNKYLILEGISLIYDKIKPIFRKISSLVVKAIGVKPTDKAKETHVDKLFNTQEIITEVYGKKVPKPIKWGISFLIRKIPFIPLLEEIVSSRNNISEEDATEQLYIGVNKYIHETIFEGNNMKWKYYLLSISVIIELVLIYLMAQYY